MPHTGIDAAPIGIMAADDHVVQPDQGGQDRHGGDEPKGTVARYGKGQADDIGFAGPPISVQNRRRAWPIHIAGAFGRAGNYHTYVPMRQTCTGPSWTNAFLGSLSSV